MQVRSFSQLRRELNNNNLFYLDTSAKGSSTSTLTPIDPSKSFVNGLTGSVHQKDYDHKLKRVDSAPEDSPPDTFYARGNSSTNRLTLATNAYHYVVRSANCSDRRQFISGK